MNEIHSFTPTEISLYFYLLKVNNLCNWAQSFNHNNHKVMASIGVSDLRTLNRARNRLKQVGLIDFCAKQRDANVKYSVFCTAKNAVESVAVSVAESVAVSADEMHQKVRTKDRERIRQDIDIKKGIKKEISLPSPPKIFNDVFSFFNEHKNQMPAITTISDSRKRKIQNLEKKYGNEKIKLMIDKAEKSNFLNGQNKQNWIANFDWILDEKNFIKILEGNYDNKNPNANERPNANFAINR